MERVGLLDINQSLVKNLKTNHVEAKDQIK